MALHQFTKLKSRHLSLMLQLFSPFMLNEASSVNGGTDRFTKEYLISEPVFTALYFLLINTLKSRQYEAFKVIAPLLDGIKCTYAVIVINYSQDVNIHGQICSDKLFVRDQTVHICQLFVFKTFRVCARNWPRTK